jgi:serine/threonine-protein kinase
LRIHGPSLLLFLSCAALSAGVFVLLETRERDRARAAFNAEAAPIVANLRSAFELPLEILEATATLFEASHEVTRAEFARFVKPALERHQGIRALEWIPIVPGEQRERYEAAARADGLLGFQFRQRNPEGEMVAAAARGEYLPIYYMEPGHPLVLGFDCASEPLRHSWAERARARGTAVASQRIQLIDDPPSSYSVVVFQPVFEASRARSPANVRGFTCEVFRVRAVAEHAIEQSLGRGLEVALLDPEAPEDRRVLFESSPGLATRTATATATATAATGLSLEAPLRYADRSWRILLSAGPEYRRGLGGAPWPVLIVGLGSGALAAFGLSAMRLIRRLRHQVRAAQQLGQYTLLEKLGEGGAGVVYKARHAMLRRPTAIKLLSGQAHPGVDAQRLARFEREVQLTSELSHPNTIAIYDYGRTAEGVLYYAMEYIDGITLEQLVERDGPLAPARVVHLLRQACEAIAEAHGVGLIHRDIKPANLMICERGGISDFIKVMDFGLVKNIGTSQGRATPEDITQSTATTVLGTPLYLAPEAIARSGEIDGRADLYALGAVAYFLLVGEPVFTGQTVVEVFGRHLHAAPVPPSERAQRDIPASLERIVLRCLEKDPQRRFPGAAALLAELEALTDAGSWSQQNARAWWRARGDALVRALRAEQAARADPAGRPGAA